LHPLFPLVGGPIAKPTVSQSRQMSEVVKVMTCAKSELPAWIFSVRLLIKATGMGSYLGSRAFYRFLARLCVVLLITSVSNVGAAQVACHSAHAWPIAYEKHLQEIERRHQVTVVDHGLRRKVILQNVQLDVRFESAIYFALRATDPISHRQEDLAFLTLASISPDGQSASLRLIKTNPTYRRNDLSTLILALALQKQPELRELRLFFAETNLQVFNQALIDSLRTHPLFAAKALSAIEKQKKETLGFFAHSSEQTLKDHLRACCSRIPHDVLWASVSGAIRMTPFFRSARVLGFQEINQIEFDPNANPEIFFSIRKKDK